MGERISRPPGFIPDHRTRKALERLSRVVDRKYPRSGGPMEGNPRAAGYELGSGVAALTANTNEGLRVRSADATSSLYEEIREEAEGFDIGYGVWDDAGAAYNRVAANGLWVYEMTGGANGADEGLFTSVRLRKLWQANRSPVLRLLWFNTAGGAGNVGFILDVKSLKAGDDSSAAFNNSTYTQAAAAANLAADTGENLAVAPANLGWGDILYLKLTRDSADTYGSSIYLFASWIEMKG